MRLTYKNQRGKIYAYLEEGPVAQLGARFNRTEEAEGSNPSRSTGESEPEKKRINNKNMGP
jgi:hypothetical protein